MYKKITMAVATLSLTGCMFGETSIQKADSASTTPTLPACTSDNGGNCSISVASKTLLEPNLIAANITNGISIFGVTGTAVIPSPCTNDNAGSCRITQANKTLLEPNLVAGNIKTGTTVFGVTGTLPVYAACVNDNNGNCAIPGANKTGIEPNLLATNIMNGVTVFGVTGTYQGPTPCTNDNGGSCRITQANKTLLEANLIAANIKSGITIFGVLGSYTGSGAGSLASHMHRDPATTQMSILDESTANAGTDYVNNDPGYRAVSRINKDDDGYTGGSVVYVDRSTWGSNTCGTAQATLNARIANCATVFGANATWDGSTKGNAGQAVWKLVSRTGDVLDQRGREVWRDERTGLLWSSLVSNYNNGALTWCKAVGSNNIAGNPTAKVDPQGYCDNSSYQTTGTAPADKAVSACFEDDGTYFTTTDPNLDNAGKAGLMRASTPSVAWRLPSKYDFQQADNDGFRFVMPDAGLNSSGYEWSSSVYSGSRYYAWVFVSNYGFVNFVSRYFNKAVRCVGR
jgi:hypothetical protein